MLTFSSKPRSSRVQRQPPAGNGPGPGLAPLSSQRPAPRLVVVDEPVDSDSFEEAVLNKGWHDSSSELKRGLDVTENVPLDALPPEWRAPFAPSRRR